MGGTPPRTGGQPGPERMVDKNFAEWQKHTKGFGLKMLEKMGYRVGEGLGVNREGIVNPIQSKLRPTKMGIAYKNYKEKSSHEIAEARRKAGERSSDSEEDDATAVIGDGRRRTRLRKPEVVYKTADEVILEASGNQSTVSRTLNIIDMTGPQAREVSAGSITAFTESDKLRLAVDMSKHDLERLARERSTHQSLSRALAREEEQVHALVEEESRREQRLLELIALAAEVEARCVHMSQTSPPPLLDPLEGLLRRLAAEYAPEVETYQLDELVVAAIAPVVQGMFAEWEPLQDPTFASEMFARWRDLFKTNDDVNKNKVQHMNGLELAFQKTDTKAKMTPYESLIYATWLPRVRSAISNSWDVMFCDPLITLLEAWQPPVLPTFIYENVLDQLVLPKLQRLVDNWDPRLHRNNKNLMPHYWLHPWLPVLGDRLVQLFSSIRHKFAVALRNSKLIEGEGLSLLLPWRKVFRTKDMNNLVDKTVMPNLRELMRVHFHVNPRNQSLTAFNAVLPWHQLSSVNSFSHLLETEFFPKWLRALHAWLTAKPNYDEITEWYGVWKSLFPPALLEAPAVKGGFKRALDMYNLSLELGADIPHPDTAVGSAATGILPTPSSASVAASRVTFRDIVEEFAQENSQLFLPTSRVHPATGKQLFRFGGRPPAGAGGLWVYLDSDVVFALVGGGDLDEASDTAMWEPVGLEELLELAEEQSTKAGRK